MVKKRRVYLLPIYYLVSLSRVGRELILHQGSAEYQDLVYRNRSEGRFVIGKIFDRYLLDFPTAKGCRSRLTATQETLRQLIETSSNGDIQILDLACGYGHSLIGTLEGMKDRNVRAYGLDLDEKAIQVASARAGERGMANVTFHLGNVLDLRDYPVQAPDIVVLNGLAQYLAYEERIKLYQNIHLLLREGGYLLTDYFCNWANNPLQKWWKGVSEEFLGATLDWLGKEDLEKIFSQLPFRDVKIWYCHEGLCLMILARK